MSDGLAPEDPVLAYVTAGDDAEAARIARALVADKLVACANILGGIRSFYAWEGEVKDDPEVLLVAKTRAGLRAAVTRKVVETHGYDLPCVIFFPIQGGHAPFLDWIGDETRAP